MATFAAVTSRVRLAPELRVRLDEERRTAETFTWGAFLFVNVGPDAQAARAAAAAHISRVYRVAGESIIDRFGAAGPVAACADRVRAYLDAGADYIVLSPACDHGGWPRQLASYGDLIAELGGGKE